MRANMESTNGYGELIGDGGFSLFVFLNSATVVLESTAGMSFASVASECGRRGHLNRRRLRKHSAPNPRQMIERSPWHARQFRC
jgi:hypothetical protein